jgi:hypothetical protein
MKTLPVILAVSLAGNAALAFFVLSKHERASVAPLPAQAQTGAADKVLVSKEAAARAVAAEGFAEAVRTGNAVAVRDHLRAMGLPDEVIRQAVRAVLWKPAVDLSRELAKKQNKDGQAYWRSLPGMFSPNTMSKEDRTRLRELNRGAARQLEELMGPDPTDFFSSRYSFLPQEKLSKIRDMESDYSELRSQISSEIEGFRLPSDEEKMAYLEKEQRKDLEAMLSPEELAEYDRRNSSTANRLRFQLRNFDASEQEYKTIFDLQKSFDDKYSYRRNDPNSSDIAKQRELAQQDLQAQLKAALGEERYNGYMRSQDQDYAALQAAAKRFDLPKATVDQVYTARDETLAAVQQITKDANLSPEQRTQAMAKLANETRTKIKSALGDEVGTAYLRNSMRWLDAVQRGTPVSVGPTGNVTVQGSGGSTRTVVSPGAFNFTPGG